MPVLAFVQGNFEPTVLAATPYQGYLADAQVIAVNCASYFEFGNQIIIDHAVDLDVVDLVEMACGIGNSRSPLGIVRQQQQTFARLIESAYRPDPRRAGFEQTVNCLSSFFVRRGRHHASRFIHCEVKWRALVNWQTVDVDTVAIKANRTLRIANDSLVHTNTLFSNQ